MSNKMRSGLFAVLGALLLAVPVFAHHSFEAEFRSTDPVEVKGVMSKVDWINPHIYLYVDVKDASGKVTTWSVEGGPTRHMRDAGVTRNSVEAAVGQNMDIWGYPAKDGKTVMFLKTMYFPDGHFISYHLEASDLSGNGEVHAQGDKH
jgi:hypothetical protein